ncbi:HtaA domain-containing protein [Kitasatospora sp. NPDC057015]|uniref:HtaA domain-containing protein n=1 Tax=Kitasatospora sp. NPDC057015 TaxID=3346001 RepID=UPI003628E254
MPRRLRRLAATLVAALAALLAVSLLPVQAVAAEGRVAGGRLDWGIKQSFLSYVTGPIAKGSWGLTGGAATVGGSTFRFHSATGAYDPETGALSASFSGGVRFTGHQENGVNVLDLSIGRLTLRAGAGGGAGLYADVSSRSKDTGKVTAVSQARLADLSLAGLDLRGAAGTLTLSNVPATLTGAGANAFGGFYTAGTALDPLTLSVNLPAAKASPSATGQPAGAEPAGTPAAATPVAPAGTPAGESPAPAPARTEFTGGSLDWGVRRTFRDYVTGSIAKGGWEVSGGAADGGAFFRWTPAKGGYDPVTGALTAAFAGGVHFTGMKTADGYGLDLVLANAAVTVADGHGRLTADVSGRTPDGAVQQAPGVELATFEAGVLKPEGGLLKAVELPLKLSESGAKAFGGLYPAGADMDPLSFAVALDPAAVLPPLPDIGSAPAAAPAPAVASPAPATAPVAAEAAKEVRWPAVAAVGGLLVLALATAGVVLARRRRTAATPAADGPATTDEDARPSA